MIVKPTSFLLFLTIMVSVSAPVLYGQQYSRYNDPVYLSFERYTYDPHTRFHSSIRPLMLSEVDSVVNTDSIIREMRFDQPVQKKWVRWVRDKAFNEDLLILKRKGVNVNVNVLFDFGVGNDLGNSRNTWQNTRGFLVEGTLVDKVSFSTGYLENQTQFVPYIDAFCRTKGIIPGQGTYKTFKEDAYDYGNAFGHVSYSPSSYFNFEIGYGKNFIGDGHRSMLLSDNSFNYPYLKIATNFWNIKYICLYAQFINREQPTPYGMGYAKKYGTFHYLDWAITPRLNVGLFEAVIWSATDTSGYQRGFDWSYVNPIIFLRPAEFSVGSPDNSLMGLNASMKVFKNSVFYGQFLLDEFKLKEVLAGDGWYANKWGGQIGFKTFNLFNLRNLDFQTEVNLARPFTYSHWNYSNYAHYSQPLAHPLGANFRESVTFLKYHYRRWFLSNEFQYYCYGADTAGYNYGGDIFKFYTTRTNEYGNTITQGLKTTVVRNETIIGYLINPATNMNISLGYVYRNEKTDLYRDNTGYLYLAFRTSLWNRGYDF